MSPWLVLLWIVVAGVGLVAATTVATVAVIAWAAVRDHLADRRRDRTALDGFHAALDAYNRDAR